MWERKKVNTMKLKRPKSLTRQISYHSLDNGDISFMKQDVD